jgi:hypothetical protein
MCWSAGASLTLTVVGFSVVAIAAYRKKSPLLWVPLGYFTLMELLQALSYPVLDKCSLPSNQLLTLLGYLHICFQPFFINLFSFHFIPEKVRQKVQYPVFGICFVCSIMMIMQLIPMEWAGHCDLGRSLCGDNLCTVSGTWHLAWNIPLNGLGNYFYRLDFWLMEGGFPSYIFAGFILPLLYGSWKFTLYHALFGPLLAITTTENRNESPAVWCLLSIALLLSVILTPLRSKLLVHSWFLWPAAWRSTSKTEKVL